MRENMILQFWREYNFTVLSKKLDITVLDRIRCFMILAKNVIFQFGKNFFIIWKKKYNFLGEFIV